MENAAIKTAETNSPSKTASRSRSAGKGKRRGSGAASRARSAQSTSLVERGMDFADRAQKWAGNARIPSPIVDFGSNAVIIGAVGLVIGVGLGALLPKMSLPEMPQRMMRNGSAGNGKSRSARKGK